MKILNKNKTLSYTYMVQIRHSSKAPIETIRRATRVFADSAETMAIIHHGFNIIEVQKFIYDSYITTVIYQDVDQEITNYAVAASKLSHPLCSIIEVSARRTRKKAMQLTIFYWLLTIVIDFFFVVLGALRGKT